MELFATDRDRLAFLLETDAALDLDFEALEAQAEAAAEEPSPEQRPKYITLTSSAICSTTDKSCEMNTYDRPKSCCKSIIRFSTCARTETSSAETGSSAITTSGSSIRPRAIAIR